MGGASGDASPIGTNERDGPHLWPAREAAPRALMSSGRMQIGDDVLALACEARLARIRDFVALTKPRPMSIVLAAAAAGLLAAPGPLDPPTAAAALLAIAAGGGGSAALNMWYERDLDRLMVRTAARPVAAGRIAPGEALAFALASMLGGVALMALAVSPAAAAMLAATIAFYGVVYTIWLKRATALNVLIGGGVASVLTPLTGWVAATGSLSAEAMALFAFLLPWTAPHVWSQALVRRDDYDRAGVPMMPVVAGSERTRWLIVLFTATHVALSLLPVVIGAAGTAFALTAVVAGAALTIEAVRLAQIEDEARARQRAWTFYRWSIAYVVMVTVVLVADRWLWPPVVGTAG